MMFRASSVTSKMIQLGTSWVAVDEDEKIVGFLTAEPMADELHIWAAAVRHDKQGLGHGRALVQEAKQAARQNGFASVTLTTFRDIRWNEPFYQQLGFQTLAPEQVGERLNGGLRSEADHGLPRQRRCAMRIAIGRDDPMVK